MRHSITFAILVAAACGPTVATDVATDDDTTTDVPHGTGAEVASSGDVETSVTPSSDSTDTGAIEDACASSDPAACPDECYRGSALQVIDGACGTTSVDMCLPGGTKPVVPPTTYWALAPSGPVFVEYGGPCSAAARPDVWHECSGAADEPADCACFCQGGYCVGDEDRRALDECGLDWACDPLFVDPAFGAADHDAEACVLEGLGARTPGVYEITTSGGFSVATTRFYVFGDDAVMRVDLLSGDIVGCPATSDWGGASSCTLASEAFFASCLEPQPEGQACVFGVDAWASECVAGAPTCG